MPLLTNPAGRKLYVLRRISTSEVLNRAIVYPNAVDDAPIIGLDPDLEFLAMDSDVMPAYDSRQFDLTITEAKVGNLWRITYATPEKEPEQIKAAIANRERVELDKHVASEERDKLIWLALGTFYKADKGLTLTEAETAVKDRVLAISAKLWENDAAKAQLFAAVDAGQPLDLDTVWAAKG